MQLQRRLGRTLEVIAHLAAFGIGGDDQALVEVVRPVIQVDQTAQGRHDVGLDREAVGPEPQHFGQGSVLVAALEEIPHQPQRPQKERQQAPKRQRAQQRQKRHHEHSKGNQDERRKAAPRQRPMRPQRDLNRRVAALGKGKGPGFCRGPFSSVIPFEWHSQSP